MGSLPDLSLRLANPIAPRRANPMVVWATFILAHPTLRPNPRRLARKLFRNSEEAVKRRFRENEPKFSRASTGHACSMRSRSVSRPSRRSGHRPSRFALSSGCRETRVGPLALPSSMLYHVAQSDLTTGRTRGGDGSSFRRRPIPPQPRRGGPRVNARRIP